MTREAFIQKRERRRLFDVSFATLLGFALLIILFWWLESAYPRELSDTTGPLLIKIGRADAEDIPLPPSDSALESEAVLETEPVEEVVEEPEQVVEVPQEPIETEKVEPLPIAEPVKQETKPVPVPVPEKKPAKVVEKASPAKTVPKQKSPETIVKGSEAGNAYETVFGAESDIAGWYARPEIALYMPLPNSLPSVFFDKIPAFNGASQEQNKDFFLNWYNESADGGYILKNNDVPLTQRPRLWLVLESAGYKLANADYKSRVKSSLVLAFSVKAASPGKQPEISDVKIKTSSGDAKIDEAAAFGFMQSAVFNKTDQVIKGTFTYRF